MKPMARAALDGIELEYEVRGAGEPIVLVHAGLVAEWFKPLLQERALTDRYHVVSYHRVGYAGSSRVAGPVGIAQQQWILEALEVLRRRLRLVSVEAHHRHAVPRVLAALDLLSRRRPALQHVLGAEHPDHLHPVLLEHVHGVVALGRDRGRMRDEADLRFSSRGL